MKQVFNWTIGSFFRTIGRIAAFLIVGGFIAYLLAHSNIDWGIKDLFLDRVDALSITENVIKSGDGYFTPSNPNDYSRVTTDYIYNWSYATTNVVQWYYIPSDNIPTQEHDYIELPFILGLPSSVRETYVSTDYYCDKFQHAIDSMNNEYWECVSERGYNDPAQVAFSQNFSSSSIYASITYGDLAGNWAGWASCYIQNNNIVCPLQHNKTILSIRIDSRLQSNNQFAWYEIYLYRGYNFYKSQDIQGAINQQTQVIQDSNTTSESSQASNYVNNYQDDTPTGLTAAVTAPLNIMNNLVLGNSSPLCFTLNSKQTCFPDGSLVWGNNHTQGKWFKSGLSDPKGAFVILFNLVVGGFLCYKMLISMLRIWNNMLDPTNTKIEVMKL